MIFVLIYSFADYANLLISTKKKSYKNCILDLKPMGHYWHDPRV